MHGDIDAVAEQRFLDLLGEQALAAGFRQRPVLDAVAAGGDRLDGEGRFRKVRVEAIVGRDSLGKEVGEGGANFLFASVTEEWDDNKLIKRTIEPQYPAEN